MWPWSLFWGALAFFWAVVAFLYWRLARSALQQKERLPSKTLMAPTGLEHAYIAIAVADELRPILDSERVGFLIASAAAAFSIVAAIVAALT